MYPPGHWVAAEHGKRGKERGYKSGNIFAPTDQAEQARATGPEDSGFSELELELRPEDTGRSLEQ